MIAAAKKMHAAGLDTREASARAAEAVEDGKSAGEALREAVRPVA